MIEFKDIYKIYTMGDSEVRAVDIEIQEQCNEEADNKIRHSEPNGVYSEV